MSITSLYNCLLLKNLAKYKEKILIKASNNVSCIKVRLNNRLSLSINKTLLNFIKDKSGIYAFDLLLTYKLHFPDYSINNYERALNMIGGLYGVYRRALKLNYLYNDLHSIINAKKILKKIYDCLDCEEAKLILSLLNSYTFEEFINKLNDSNEFKDLRIFFSLLKGEKPFQDLLKVLENVNIQSIDPFGYYVLASMIVQELVIQHKISSQEVKRLFPYISLINRAIKGGIRELIEHILSHPNNDMHNKLNYLLTLLDTISFEKDNFSMLVNLYLKLYLKNMISLNITSLENLLPIVKGIINTTRFCLYYEFYEKKNFYIPLLDTLLNEDFNERLAYTTLEYIMSRNASQLSTNLVIKPIKTNEFKESHNIAVVFGSFKGSFKNLLWDLGKDAEEYSLFKGFKVKVVGTLFNWLIADYNKIKARRALILHKDHIDEVTFNEPIPIHSCFILNLPIKNERDLHMKFSKALEECKVTLINPYKVSMRADDKLLTHQLFEAYNAITNEQLIRHPMYICIRRSYYISSSLSNMLKFLKRFNIEEVVVKPVHGTEGLYVAYFNLKKDTYKMLEHINKILKFDDVIIEEFKGNLLYKGKLHFVIRVNVSWNGEEFKVESGYSQVALKEGYKIATTSHGGKIININELFRHLYFKADNGQVKKYHLTRKDIDKIKGMCIEVARAINLGLCEEDYLKYMGIDLVLELRENEILPIVLEVNSRPSGLSYSYTLSYNYEKELGEANVIKNLIKYLETL